MFSEQDDSATTTNDIADEADVSRASFHQYFTNNDAPLVARVRGACAAPRRGRETSSPPQFGRRYCISLPHVAQRVHSKRPITASPASSSVVLHGSQAVRISNVALALLRPKVIDESLVLIEEPAFAQLLVLHSIQQNSAYSPRRLANILHRNERAKRVANEHILDRNQLP
jgi:hypothetical protein